MRVVLSVLFIAGLLIAALGVADGIYEARLTRDGHAEINNVSIALAALVATAGLILAALSGFGVSALNKLAVMRDVLLRAQAASPAPNPYTSLPTYHDPNAARRA